MTNSASRISDAPLVQQPAGGLKSDQAYQLLKRSILTLEYAPGALLIEAELMERFKVGRTPLREALQRLAVEGLVTTVPRRGTFVSSISADDVQAVYEMRCRLDAFAAELAAERATKAEIGAMEKLLHEFDTASEIDASLFDQQMHELIAQAAHNPYLHDTLNRLYTLSVRQFNLRHYQRETFAEMRTELGAVVEAIKARDPKQAAREALQHVTSRGWFPNIRSTAEVNHSPNTDGPASPTDDSTRATKE